jgi:hypothetical protein
MAQNHEALSPEVRARVADARRQLMALGLSKSTDASGWTSVVNALVGGLELLEKACPPPLNAGVAVLTQVCSTAVKRARGVRANHDMALKLAALVQDAAAEVMDVFSIGGPLPTTLLDSHVHALADAIDAAANMMDEFSGKRFVKLIGSTKRDSHKLQESAEAVRSAVDALRAAVQRAALEYGARTYELVNQLPQRLAQERAREEELRRVRANAREEAIEWLDSYEYSRALLSASTLKFTNTLFLKNGVHGPSCLIVANPAVEVLDLTGNFLMDPVIGALADAIELNGSLACLGLNVNWIGDQGAIWLAEVLKFNKSLLVLKLAGNSIGNAGALSLAEALKVNSTLIVLNLSHNDQGAIGLAKALEVNSTALTELHLGDHKLSASAALALADMLRVNTSLNMLYLERIPFHDSSKSAIRTADPRLMARRSAVNVFLLRIGRDPAPQT